ncbi:hypothetical protein [Pseudomonas aeruginosa]|uniref:hypothetical protein n=1 Tax=Pseudomonas aeruginosa TaxID=287 RepID=UPI0017820B14|nr:hypothetical protein [Pseudomonas aeruginosa]
MTESKICTCPSGDGSLVHPCPAHPAVEQVGGDERAAFELFVRKHCGMPAHIAVNWDAKFTNDAWEGWKARAALAQPSPPPHPASELDFSRPLETENGDPVKWICADVIEYKSARVCVAKDTGLVYSSPYIGLKIRNVMPEQAEAERPEVAEVAFVLRNIGAMDAEDIDGDNVDLRFEDAEGRDTGCDVSIVEYAEKAADLFEQHDRIVGALRAEITQLRQHKNDYMDAGQETYRALQNEIRDREAEIARLDGLVSGRTAERDAALARVAELERQEPVALANRGLHAFWVKWTEAAAGLYGPGIKLYAAPVAQAQHSVPIAPEFKRALGLVVATLEADGDRPTSKYALSELKKVLAAAPGKEVGHE